MDYNLPFMNSFMLLLLNIAAVLAIPIEPGNPQAQQSTSNGFDPSRFNPNKSQTTTLIVIGAYILGIMILWNAKKIIKFDILLPFKLVTVVFHEFGHAITVRISLKISLSL